MIPVFSIQPKFNRMIDFLFQTQPEYVSILIQLTLVLLISAILYYFRKQLFDSKIVNIEITRYKMLGILILLITLFSGFLFAIKMPIRGDEAFQILCSYGAGEGLIPYRDFAYHAFPLSLYAYGLFFKITGTSFLAARVLSFLFFLFSLYLIYRIFAFYFKQPFILLTIFLLLVFLHPADFSQFFYISTKESLPFFIILLSLFFLKDNTKKSLFLSGIFAGLALGVKQPFLVLLPIGFLVILIANYKKGELLKKEVSFFLGFLAIIIPSLFFLLPYFQQFLYNTLTGLWKLTYFNELVKFSAGSSMLELKFFSAIGWVLRHYIIFSIWIFLLIIFFRVAPKQSLVREGDRHSARYEPSTELCSGAATREIVHERSECLSGLGFRKEILNIPIAIVFLVLFVLIYGISSLIFIPAALHRHLIIMSIFLFLSFASLTTYFLEKSQYNIKIKRNYLAVIFLILVLIGTNSKQISYYFLLNNQVIDQYRNGPSLGNFIKSLPQYKNRQIVFVGASSHLLAQGDIPARKIYPASYWEQQLGLGTPLEDLSLDEAKYYHYMTEKVLMDILKKKENFIIVYEPFFREEFIKYWPLIEKSFSHQDSLKVGNQLYKIYY